MHPRDLPLYKRLRSAPELLDPERRAEVVDAAASWSRLSARGGWNRVQAAAWPIAQTAIAAGLAWLIAGELLGHPRPFFAPVAAIIALGVMRGQRARRAFEMLLGVALAMAAAVVLNAGQLMLTEAAMSAALVSTVAPAQGFPPTRLLDALVGGG